MIIGWNQIKISLVILFLGIGLRPPCVWAGDELSILAPPGCLPADGGPSLAVYVYTAVAIQQQPITLEAELGKFATLKALSPHVLHAEYFPPTLRRSKTIRFTATRHVNGVASSQSEQVNLCPYPVGRIWIQAKPNKLLAAKQQESVLSIRVVDEKQSPLVGGKLQITTNIGRVTGLKELENGEYRAIYTPPDDPFPQVAIIMVANPRLAKLDRIAVGRAVIPITASIKVPGKTSPKTKMEMTVAGKTFGPVEADQNGEFSIPILVPPGYGKGKAVSIDQVGNRDLQWIELFLPETNQLGLWGYPKTLPADGRAKSRLLVTVTDPYGIAGNYAKIDIRAERGRIGSIKNIGKGFYEAYYTTPNHVGTGVDILEVVFPEGGRKSRAVMEMKLKPGPASQIRIEVPRTLPADGQTQGNVEVYVQDASGNPVGNQNVSLQASFGRLTPLKEISAGVYQSRLVIPVVARHWQSELTTKVVDEPGSRPVQILVTKESLYIEPNGIRTLTPVLVDRTGRPVENFKINLLANGIQYQKTTGAFGRAKFELRPSGQNDVQVCLFSVNEDTVQKLVYWVNEETGAQLLPINLNGAVPPNQPIEHTAVVQIHPPLPVDLKMEATRLDVAGDTWVIKASIVDARGQPCLGKKIIFSTSAGRLDPVQDMGVGAYQTELHLDNVDTKHVMVTAMDLESRVGAVIEINTDQP